MHGNLRKICIAWLFLAHVFYRFPNSIASKPKPHWVLITLFFPSETSVVKPSSISNYSLFSCFVFFSSKNMQKMCGKTCNLIQRAAKKHVKIIIFRVLFHCKPLFFMNVLNVVLNVYLNTKCYFHGWTSDCRSGRKNITKNV